MRFEIVLNGKRLCTAGMDLGVLSSTITWLRKDGSDSRVKPRNVDEVSENGWAELCVGGLHSSGAVQDVSDEIWNWANTQLHPGDEIIVRVLPPGPADEPAHRTRRDERRPPAVG